MIQNDFEKVFMINLDDQPERLVESKINCAKWDIEFERVTAVPGSSLEGPKNESEGWNKNSLGLCLTTINIIESAIENNWESVFILEDDVSFVDNFEILYKALIKGVPDKWDFIHLNAEHKRGKEYAAPFVYKLKYAWCCQAYGIHKQAYLPYLEKLKVLDRPIDQCTAELHGERKNSYSSSVNIVYHVSHKYSTIREQVVKY